MSELEIVFKRWQGKQRQQLHFKAEYRFVFNPNADDKVLLQFYNHMHNDWQTANHFINFEELISFLEKNS